MTDDAMIHEGRIVVVSDDRERAREWCQALINAGFTNVGSLADVVDPSSRIPALEPDLVLVDVDRLEPDMLRPLAFESDVVPVLVIHDEGAAAVRFQALSRGVDHCLRRPVDQAEVVLHVHNLIRSRLGHVQLQRRIALLESQLRDRELPKEEEVRRDRHIEMDVQRLLDDPAFPDLTCVYQPIVSFATAEVVGLEALTRFPSTIERSTDSWFTEAARVGLAPRLELTALRVALEDRSHLPQPTVLQPRPFMSMNISPHVLRSPALRALVDSIEAPDGVVMELTDNEPSDDYRPLTDAIEHLRHRGVRLAMDDPGAGFASLSHFVRLEPDIIKLGGDMVSGIHEDKARRALVSALVHFAQQSGAMLIATRIESHEELAVVRDLGVEYGQGYYLARPAALPLPVDEVHAIAARVVNEQGSDLPHRAALFRVA
jgi:EAL domain-containing protein (putative c-di-GMP-specific phosphodiesterase class I)